MTNLKEEIIKKMIAYYLLLLSGEGCIFCKNNTCSIGVCAKHSTSGMPYVIQPGSNYEIMCELN
jgi:hypothetical protein